MDQYIFNIQHNVLSQLKFWHWQTTGFASHVAIGDLYQEISDLIDEVVEVWQGRTQSRITIEGFDMIVPTDFKDAATVVEMLSQLVERTIAQIAKLEEVGAYGEVTNLLEEVNAALSKSMYLLSLK